MDASLGSRFDSNPGPLFDPPLVAGDCNGDGDDDGLDQSLEREAGFDPCKNDTDGDGCMDGAEYYFGGCDDPRNAILQPVCFSSTSSVRVRFTAKATDGGVWPLLRLTSSEPGVSILAIDTLDAGLSTRGDAFVSVASGAVLTFEVQAYSSRTFVLELTLSAEPGKPLDHGKVLMVGKRCPIPI